MPPTTFHERRLVGVHAERVSHVSSTDYPGVYPGEDHSWDLEIFKKVRRPRALARWEITLEQRVESYSQGSETLKMQHRF